MRKINELKTLRNLRPWVNAEFMLRVEGRLENAELPINARHPFWGTLRILQNGGCTVLVAFIAFTHRLGRVKKLCNGPPWQCWQITRGVKQERSNISSEMFLKLPRFNCLCLLFMKYIIGYSLCCSFASCCFTVIIFAKLNRVFIACYRTYETLTFVIPEPFFYTVFLKGLPMLAQKMLCYLNILDFVVCL